MSSKFAIDGMAQSMRIELAGSGIEISLLNTGPVQSNFRKNAYAALLRWVNPEESINSQRYRDDIIPRLSAVDGGGEKSWHPDVVYKAVSHAITSKRPRPHYYITPPTKALSVLRRFLPTRSMDWILKMSS